MKTKFSQYPLDIQRATLEILRKILDYRKDNPDSSEFFLQEKVSTEVLDQLSSMGYKGESDFQAGKAIMRFALRMQK